MLSSSISNQILTKSFKTINEIKESKFKTELCKNWENSGFCPYGIKCRFAHGKDEVQVKEIEADPNYRAKDCLNFFKFGFCNYGRRCCFRHDERRIPQQQILLDTQILLKLRNPNDKIRMPIFEEITISNTYNFKAKRNSKISNSTASTSVTKGSYDYKKKREKRCYEYSHNINEIEEMIDFSKAAF